MKQLLCNTGMWVAIAAIIGAWAVYQAAGPIRFESDGFGPSGHFIVLYIR